MPCIMRRPVLTAADGPMDATACIGAAAADIEATRQTAAGVYPPKIGVISTPQIGLMVHQCSCSALYIFHSVLNITGHS